MSCPMDLLAIGGAHCFCRFTPFRRATPEAFCPCMNTRDTPAKLATLLRRNVPDVCFTVGVLQFGYLLTLMMTTVRMRTDALCNFLSIIRSDIRISEQ